MGLAEMLRQASEAEGREAPRISREGQVARLREAAERFHRPLPFKVGDLVTPCQDSLFKGRGEPHLVIDTRPDAEHLFVGNDDGAQTFGQRCDMRIIRVARGDTIVAYWVESAHFEHYTGPTEP